jgi:DNA-binding transcriptional MerR regulator
MKSLTTREAAKAAGVSRATLQAWIAAGMRAPTTKLVEGKATRLWSAADLKRLRSFKERFYRKGRGRKPKR